MTASPAPSTTLSAEPVLPGDGAEWTPPSWDEVVREHADRVYRLAYRLTGNQHDAEDLTQETFVRVFRSLSSYKPGTFEGWLHRITTNLFLDMVRRRARIRMEALPEDSDRIAGQGPEPEQVFSDTHLDPLLQEALDELPPEFRAAVVLCDVEGLSYEEIGATLGVKLGTVTKQDPPRSRGVAQLLGAPSRRPRGGTTVAGGRGVSAGGRLFSVQVPDWGQDHLTVEAVAAYVDGELAERPYDRATRHLAACPECAAQVVAQGQARVGAAVGALSEPAVLADVDAAVDPARHRAARPRPTASR